MPTRPDDVIPDSYDWATDGVELTMGRWLVPGEVEADGELLLWNPAKAWDRSTASATDGPLLAEFLRLADGRPEEVAEFAGRWGVLGLCRHGLPRGHNVESATLMHSGRPGHGPCGPVPARNHLGYTWSEPVNAWRELAKQAAAIIDLAQGLHAAPPRIGNTHLWEALPRYRAEPSRRAPTGPRLVGESGFGRKTWRPEPGFVPKTVTAAREWIALTITEWMRWGDLRPTLDWERSANLGIAPVSLFGAIALEIGRAAARAEPFVKCHGCGAPFGPDRPLKSGLNHYCPTCRKAGVPQRDAGRRYRQTPKYQETLRKAKASKQPKDGNA